MREDNPPYGPLWCETVEFFLVLDVLVALSNDLLLCSGFAFELLEALHYDLEENEVVVGDLVQKRSVFPVDDGEGEEFAEVEDCEAFFQDFPETG